MGCFNICDKVRPVRTGILYLLVGKAAGDPILSGEVHDIAGQGEEKQAHINSSSSVEGGITNPELVYLERGVDEHKGVECLLPENIPQRLIVDGGEGGLSNLQGDDERVAAIAEIWV